MILVENIKTTKRNPDFLFPEEMVDLLDGIDTQDDLGIRNKAMLEIMYASGLRCSEVVNLTLDCIDFHMVKGTKTVMFLSMNLLVNGY